MMFKTMQLLEDLFDPNKQEDGSWRAEFRPGGNAGRTTEPLPIRAIDFTIDDGRGESGPYRLFTTIIDPAEASAEELAAT